VDNHRIHAFTFPVRGQRIPRCGSRESAQPRDDLDRAITLHCVETAKLGIGAAGPFHSIQAAFALGIEAFTLRLGYAVACYSFLEEAVAGTEAFSDSESYARSDAQAYTRAHARPDSSSDSGTDPGARTDSGSDSGTDPGSGAYAFTDGGPDAKTYSRPDAKAFTDAGTDSSTDSGTFTDGGSDPCSNDAFTGRLGRIRRSDSACQYEDRRGGQGRKRKLQGHTVCS